MAKVDLLVAYSGGIAIITVVAGVASRKMQSESYDGTGGASMLPAEVASTLVPAETIGPMVHFGAT
jgi:hypothetical protein